MNRAFLAALTMELLYGRTAMSNFMAKALQLSRMICLAHIFAINVIMIMTYVLLMIFTKNITHQRNIGSESNGKGL
jgi:hypothetical protein